MKDGSKAITVTARTDDEVVDKLQAAMPGLAKGDITLADPLPPGVVAEPVEDFMARGRAPDCDCGLVQCVCVRARTHAEDCGFRKALTCAIGFECDAHQLEVCPRCDPCTCGGPAP